MAADSPPEGAGHVVLVGLPGAGKSTVGRLLSQKMGRAWLDFDEEIERREGRTISELFAAEGEAYFRKCERTLTEKLAAGDAMVLAPGGGWMLDSENIRLVRPPGHLVYLRVSPEVALERMGAAVAARPLLRRADPIGELRRLHVERDKVYMNADLFIDTELVGVSELTELIADYVRTVEHD